MPSPFRPLALLVVASALGTPAWAQAPDASPVGLQDAPRGMVPEDYYDFRFVSDPRISPDGRHVLFVVGTVAEDRRTRESRIWIVPTDGGEEARPFTRGPSDRAPRWSPDGSRIAFLARRDEETQLHLIPIDGGEAYAATKLHQGSISDFDWAPDGRAVLLTLALDPEVEDPTREEEEEPDPRADVVEIRHALYKSDGTGYLDERRRGLWVLELDGEASGDGSSLRRLTDPTPDANDRNAEIAPDGRAVFLNADRTGGEYEGGFNQDLWTVPWDGGEARRIPTPAGRAESPVLSPDGRWMVYRHTEERYARAELHLVPVPALDREGSEAPEPVVLTADVDLGHGDVRWAPSGEALFFVADFRGSRPLFRLPVTAGAPDLVPGGPVALPEPVRDGAGWGSPGPAAPLLGSEGSIGGYTVSRDGSRIAFTIEDEATLPQVWVADGDGSNARRLASVNDALLESLDLGRLEEFRFANEVGIEVQGFLLRPVGWVEGRRFPLVLNIKGGPSGMWGRQWFHESQMMAARGYAVAFVNYRGSTGYGHGFQSEVRLDYGGADARDNLLAVDTVLARNPWIDPDRLFVTGGSHGGFLTNWITTRTERFRAAVTQRSVSNWISEAGTQQYTPAEMREEFGGTIWENFDLYWDRSPLAHAHRVRTPTLVIHSDQDLITPLGQGEEWFFALKALDVPVEMVVFQGEGHGLSRGGTPVNLVERLRRILDWFDRWDAPEG
jgi:dipeptidyl aminopeptidase/acylaminoacyl peptidase